MSECVAAAASNSAAAEPQPLTGDEQLALQAAGIWSDDLQEAMEKEPQILAEYRATPQGEAIELLRAHVMRLVYVGGDEGGDDDDDDMESGVDPPSG